MADKKKELQKREAGAPGEVERTRNNPVFTPNVDILEQTDTLLITADMPGVDEKSIDITIEEGVLTLRGSVELPEHKNESLLYHEYHVGSFERSFRLNQEIDVDKVEASVKNGVLTVVLPKSEKAKPKVIQVKAG